MLNDSVRMGSGTKNHSLSQQVYQQPYGRSWLEPSLLVNRLIQLIQLWIFTVYPSRASMVIWYVFRLCHWILHLCIKNLVALKIPPHHGTLEAHNINSYQRGYTRGSNVDERLMVPFPDNCCLFNLIPESFTCQCADSQPTRIGSWEQLNTPASRKLSFFEDFSIKEIASPIITYHHLSSQIITYHHLSSPIITFLFQPSILVVAAWSRASVSTPPCCGSLLAKAQSLRLYH